MKHVKLFEAFSTSTSLAEDQINWLDKCATGGWSLNHTTGLIDVDYNFHCNQQNLTDFKGIRFGHINGGFYCDNNQITSLEGAPQSVGGGFYCYDNLLTSLEGAPQSVSGDFYCHNNLLTSLEGAPQSVGGGFSCNNNQITSLKGAPQTVRGGFYFADNPVSEKTLSSIFSLMKNRKSYQQALTEYWPKMDDNDRALMYKDLKDHSSLTPEEIRRYEALATVSRIKNYL